jgi:magnesium chelatase family protein
LGGELRQTPKLLPALIQGARAGRELIAPLANALEASWVRDATPRFAGDLRLAGHLRQVCDALQGKAAWSVETSSTDTSSTESAQLRTVQSDAPDLADVSGQFAAKRALEIAAAGEHGLLKLCTTRPLQLPGWRGPFRGKIRVAGRPRFEAA